MSVGLARDTILYGSLDFGLRLLSFLTFPFFAYALSVDEFGLLALITSAAGLLAAFFTGTVKALQRYYWEPNIEEEKRPIVVSSGLFVIAVTAVAIIAISIAVVYPLREAIAERYSLRWDYVWMTLVTLLPVHLTLYAQALLRLRFALGRYILVVTGYHLLTIAFTLLFVLGFRWGVFGFCLGTLLSASCIVPFGLLSLRQELSLGLSWPIVKRMWRFGFPLIFSCLAYWIFASVDRWMLAEMASIEQVGLYALAFKVCTILICLISGFINAWNPSAMKAYRENPNYKQLYCNALYGWFYFLVVIASGIMFFSPEMIMLIFPPTYADAAPIIPFLITGVVFWGTVEIASIGITLMERTKLFTVGFWGAAGVNIAVNWLLIPRYGAIGAAMATLPSYFLLSCFLLACSQRLHPIPLRYSKLILLGALLLLSTLGSYLVATMTWTPQLFLAKLAWMALVIASGFLLQVVSWQSLAALGNSFLPRLLGRKDRAATTGD